MSTVDVRRAVAMALALTVLAACSPQVPRGTAYQGVPPTGDRRAQDAPYYTGADPAYPRGSRSRGGGN